MNIGKDNRHPKYVCDKCGMLIPYEPQKGITVNKYYKATKYDYSPKKTFDLCENCEKKFREWLQEKELPTTEEMINRFPIWKGE